MISDNRGLWKSFSAGEITPELYGRLDLDKFQSGLAKCQNFIVLPHGPIVNRNGTDYTLEVKYSDRQTRVIPFVRSTTEAYAIELGHLYARFHLNGGTVLEATQVVQLITQANPGLVTLFAHNYNNGDTVYFSGLGGMTALNGRFMKVVFVDVNHFTLTDLAGVALDTTSYPAYIGSSGTVARVYEIVTPYDETVIDLLTLHYVQSIDVVTITHPTYAQRELRRVAINNWTLTTISFDPDVSPPAGTPAAVATGAGVHSYAYAITTISAATLKESFLSTQSNTVTNELSTAGNKNVVTWAAVGGAARYNVYVNRNGTNVFYYVGQATSTTFTDDNIVPDISTSPPTSSNTFSSPNNYPATVTYFEQRRCFAGTINEPQTLWMTRSGSESMMTSSLPIRDDDSIKFKIAAREANTIKHFVPLNELILLSASAVWRIQAQNSDVITPTSISVKPQEHIGANDAQPVVFGNVGVFGAVSGGHIHSVSYSYDVAGYAVEDLSLFAPHLFDTFDIKELAYAPVSKIVWAVRSDGTLLGATYIPKQQVLGWHQHVTDGTFESICVISESGESVLYAVVKRSVNSRTVRYIERLRARRNVALASSFFVDCGLTYNGAAATKISGLYHLEGKTVSILADGAVQAQQPVTAGSITLPAAASVVQVGLPINADAQLLPFSYQEPAFGVGIQKNVNSVYMRVYKSSGIFAGPDFSNLTQFKQRTTEVYGSPPALYTGVLEIPITPTWGPDGQVCIRQSDPLPIELQAVALEVALGD